MILGHSLFTVRTLLPAALALSLAAGAAAPFKTSEEKVPKEVTKATRKQIDYFLAKQPGKGVPLLDDSVDWNFFTNWPASFSFKGKTYELSLLNWKGGENYETLPSKDRVKPEMDLVATYIPGDGAVDDALLITTTWVDGAVRDKGILLAGRQIFFHQFYSTGALAMFMREDFSSGALLIDYYDRAGKLVGAQKNTVYTWDGKSVDEKEFSKNKKDSVWASA